MGVLRLGRALQTVNREMERVPVNAKKAEDAFRGNEESESPRGFSGTIRATSGGVTTAAAAAQARAAAKIDDAAGRIFSQADQFTKHMRELLNHVATRDVGFYSGVGTLQKIATVLESLEKARAKNNVAAEGELKNRLVDLVEIINRHLLGKGSGSAQLDVEQLFGAMFRRSSSGSGVKKSGGTTSSNASFGSAVSNGHMKGGF